MAKKKTEPIDKGPSRHYNVIPMKVSTRSVSLSSPWQYPRWFSHRGRYYIEEKPWYGTEDNWFNQGRWLETSQDPRNGLKYSGHMINEEDLYD
jgi:hypothetical protein